MDEALAFTGETGPYVQNGVVRARNIFAKLEAEGHDVRRAAGARARRWTWTRLLRGEEGDEVWSLLMLMARSEEVVEQAVRAEEVALLAKHAFAVAQAFHSYYQKPRYSVLHAESEDLRAFRAMVVDAFVRQMDALTALLGIPRAGADVSRPAASASRIGYRPARTARCSPCATTTCGRSRRPGGLPLVLAPGPPGGRRRAARTRGRPAPDRRGRRRTPTSTARSPIRPSAG